MTAPRIALLTAARNEADYLPLAIAAVAAQTVQPAVWIIVDDGSTDGTGELIQEAMQAHRFIRTLRTGAGGPRCFGAKDRAIAAAWQSLQNESFDFVAIQDADIAPARADLFEALLAAFAQDTRLGIAGGYIHERQQGEWRSRGANSPDSVAGGLQMFRQACFAQIGGYTPLPLGGEDWLAQLKAGMAGWGIRVLSDQPVRHYRVTSSAGGHWRGLLRLGMMDASFGSDPLFELLKCARRLGTSPLLLGGLLRYAGYLWAWARQQPLVISEAEAAYLRQQQRRKLRLWRQRSTARLFGSGQRA